MVNRRSDFLQQPFLIHHLDVFDFPVSLVGNNLDKCTILVLPGLWDVNLIPAFSDILSIEGGFEILPSPATGVDNPSHDPVELSVYPNPVKNLVNLRTNGPGFYSIEISSLNGQLIYTGRMEGRKQTPG